MHSLTKAFFDHGDRNSGAVRKTFQFAGMRVEANVIVRFVESRVQLERNHGIAMLVENDCVPALKYLVLNGRYPDVVSEAVRKMPEPHINLAAIFPQLASYELRVAVADRLADFTKTTFDLTHEIPYEIMANYCSDSSIRQGACSALALARDESVFERILLNPESRSRKLAAEELISEDRYLARLAGKLNYCPPAEGTADGKHNEREHILDVLAAIYAVCDTYALRVRIIVLSDANPDLIKRILIPAVPDRFDVLAPVFDTIRLMPHSDDKAGLEASISTFEIPGLYEFYQTGLNPYAAKPRQPQPATAEEMARIFKMTETELYNIVANGREELMRVAVHELFDGHGVQALVNVVEKIDRTEARDEAVEELLRAIRLLANTPADLSMLKAMSFAAIYCKDFQCREEALGALARYGVGEDVYKLLSNVAKRSTDPYIAMMAFNLLFVPTTRYVVRSVDDLELFGMLSLANSSSHDVRLAAVEALSPYPELLGRLLAKTEGGAPVCSFDDAKLLAADMLAPAGQSPFAVGLARAMELQ